MPRAQSPLPAHCRRQLPGEKPLWERPVFWAGRPLSNTRGIRGSCSRKIPIERRRRDTKALRDLSDGDVGIGQHRPGSLDIVLAEFRRTASSATEPPGGGQTSLGALHDPAIPSQALAALDAAPSDAIPDPSFVQVLMTARQIIGFVGVKLCRTLAGPAAALAHRRHGIDQLVDEAAVVNVCRGDAQGERDTLGIGDNVVLGPGPADDKKEGDCHACR